METDLDEVYYQKYLQYKQKYLELKQFKNNNNLDGGYALNPFSWFSSTPEFKNLQADDTNIPNETNMSNDDGEFENNTPPAPYNDELTNGTYLVFNITQDTDLDLSKLFVQTNYNRPEKVGITFYKVDEFRANPEFNEKSYIITKNGTKIKYTMISNTHEIDYYENKIQKVKDFLFLDKNGEEDDEIVKDLINTCYVQYKDRVNKSIDDSMEVFDKTDPIKTELVNIKSNFKQSNENADQRMSFYQNYTTYKDKVIKALKMDEYLKYKPFEFEIDIQFSRDYSTPFFKKLITEIQNKSKTQNVELNMIIKIDESYSQTDRFKFAESIKNETISNTSMYIKLVGDIALKRIENDAKKMASSSLLSSSSSSSSDFPDNK